MINTSGQSPDSMVSASANDYVNLYEYTNNPSFPLYCTLYQMSDNGTTVRIDNYKMSLTFVEIYPTNPAGPVSITGGPYNP